MAVLAVLFGWIVFLLCLGALLGLWAWVIGPTLLWALNQLPHKCKEYKLNPIADGVQQVIYTPGRCARCAREL